MHEKKKYTKQTWLIHVRIAKFRSNRMENSHFFFFSFRLPSLTFSFTLCIISFHVLAFSLVIFHASTFVLSSCHRHRAFLLFFLFFRCFLSFSTCSQMRELISIPPKTLKLWGRTNSLNFSKTLNAIYICTTIFSIFFSIETAGKSHVSVVHNDFVIFLYLRHDKLKLFACSVSDWNRFSINKINDTIARKHSFLLANIRRETWKRRQTK